MRRRFSRTRFARTPFRRHRRRVSWLTSPNQIGEEALVNHDLIHVILGKQDNDFIEAHPRLAKRDDIIPYRRIVGDIRVGLYSVNGGLREPNDYVVDYGLCFVPGSYDNTGAWSAAEYPDPADTGDEDEKWLFQNRVYLSFGNYITHMVDTTTGTLLATDTGGSLAQPQPIFVPSTAATGLQDSWGSYAQAIRPAMMSTDQQLPAGSKVDISTRRKAEYGEKLFLVARLESSATDTDQVDVFINWKLRVLANG